MRCDYALQLAKRPCKSKNKLATVAFVMLDEEVKCCPVCANILEAELKRNDEFYSIVPIDEKGEIKCRT